MQAHVLTTKEDIVDYDTTTKSEGRTLRVRTSRTEKVFFGFIVFCLAVGGPISIYLS